VLLLLVLDKVVELVTALFQQFFRISETRNLALVHDQHLVIVLLNVIQRVHNRQKRDLLRFVQRETHPLTEEFLDEFVGLLIQLTGLLVAQKKG